MLAGSQKRMEQTGSMKQAKNKMVAVYGSVGSTVEVGLFYLFPLQK